MKSHFWILVVLCGVCAAMPAAAEESPARLQLRQRSLTTGFAHASAPVLMRRLGPGNDVAAARAREVARAVLGRAIPYVQRQDGRVLRQSTPAWRLRVSDDGNNVHFEVQPDISDTPIVPLAKPSLTQIESMGRAFIKSSLSRIVTLESGEDLVFLGSRYEYSGGQSMDSPVRDPDVLEGWTSIFGRSVGGEIVIGAGSKVVVIFRADGAVKGFDVDWPAYAPTGTTAEMLDLPALRKRSTLVKGRLPQLADPVALRGALRRETAFECGMFDRGGRSKRGSVEMVQPACQETFTTAVPTGETTGTVMVVPAARVPIADDRWMEARTLCGAGQECRPRPAGW